MESTPETRNAKRDAIAAKYAGWRPIRWNQSAVASTAILAAIVATGLVESLPL